MLLGLPTRRVVRSASRVRAAPAAGRRARGNHLAQLEEDTAIRLLITDSRAGEQRDVACRWAQEWVDRLNGRGRHRASLRAERLLAACLSAAGRTVENAWIRRCPRAMRRCRRSSVPDRRRRATRLAHRRSRNDQQMGVGPHDAALRRCRSSIESSTPPPTAVPREWTKRRRSPRRSPSVRRRPSSVLI